MISFRYLFEGGTNEPNDIKIVLDSTIGALRKRKGYDTTKPYLDTSFNIRDSQWNILVKSFEMDSIMLLKNNYPLDSERVDEGERTIEIRTTSRYKKIIYHTSNFFPWDSSSEIKSLDSLNNYLWEIWRMYYK